jgi:hypothetical protein
MMMGDEKKKKMGTNEVRTTVVPSLTNNVLSAPEPIFALLKSLVYEADKRTRRTSLQRG